MDAERLSCVALANGRWTINYSNTLKYLGIGTPEAFIAEPAAYPGVALANEQCLDTV